MNSTSYFCVGTTFREDGKRFVVTEEGRRNRVIRDLESNEVTTRSASKLQQAYTSGLLEFDDLLAGANRSTESSEPVRKSLADYDQRARDEVNVKWHYLQKVCPGGLLTCRRSELVERLKSVWEELTESLPNVPRPKEPPGVSTFYDWRRQWINSHYSAVSLVNRYDLRGRRPKEIPKGLQPILQRSIDEYYLTGNRPTISATLQRAEEDVNRHNLERPPAEQLPRPTRRLLERLLDKVDRYGLLHRRYGTAYARQATRVFTQKEEPTRLLERVELDHSPLDVLVISDDSRLIVGRPYLTVLIDVYSRMIVGAWISFREPNAATVLRALKHAILPKDDLLKSYRIKGSWPARGIPSTVVVDNGKELHSIALESAALELAITLIYCPRRQPIFKGVIERFMQEINYGFIHLLPGTTFAKYYLREDYDSAKHAVIALDDLKRLIYRWIVEVYNNHYHRGINTCPLEKWQARDGNPDKPVLPRKVQLLDVILTPTESRMLGSKGIEINSLHYVSPELSDLRLRRGNQQLTVRPNLDDLGFIHVLHPETKVYFQAHCTRPDYANDLSIEQHKIFLKQARERYKSLPHYAALLSAKRDMQEEVEGWLAIHQQRVALMEKKEKQEKKRTANAANGNKEPVKQRGRPSGTYRQSVTEVVEACRKQPQQNPEPAIVSFAGLEAFATGQTHMF